MLKIIVAICAIVALAHAAPPKPKLPDVFESRVYVDLHMHNETMNVTIRADGWWALDEPDGKALEDYRFAGHHEEDIFFLQRYDTGFVYEVRDDKCDRRAVNGTIPPVWGWLAQATYQGQHKFGNQVVDLWEAQIGYANVSVGVDTKDANLPLFYARRGPQREVIVFFEHFDARKPSPNLFFPPHICPSSLVEELFKPNKVGCVQRSDMIARAQVWVDKKVPYNQAGYYGGYREDCSGYVSMAWELKSSLTTQTLPTVAHKIAKADLQPGDVLLDVQEHVVLFGGWTSGQSEYMAYEETRPGEGTVKRPTPYPYWYNQAAFIPYRFNSVC